MARINFNPEAVRPFSGALPVYPSGDYLVEIVAENEHDLSTGAGRGLTFDYRILDGSYKGGIIRDNFNLWHTSEKAVGVAQSRLVSIANAVGLGLKAFNDTHELHHKPFVVRISKVVYNGSDRNQVDQYLAALPAENSAPTAPAAPVSPSPAPAQPYWSK